MLCLLCRLSAGLRVLALLSLGAWWKFAIFTALAGELIIPHGFVDRHDGETFLWCWPRQLCCRNRHPAWYRDGAQRHDLARSSRPVLDLMQTRCLLVYLIPAAMFSILGAVRNDCDGDFCHAAGRA